MTFRGAAAQNQLVLTKLGFDMVFDCEVLKLFVTSGVRGSGVGWRWLALVLWGVLSMGQAQANCSYRVVANPAYSALYSVNPLPANNNFFNTTLAYSFTCTSTSAFSGEAIAFTFGGSQSLYPLASPITGVSVIASNPIISRVSGCRVFGRTDSNGETNKAGFYMFSMSAITSNCTFTFQVDLKYYTNGSSYAYTNSVANLSSTIELMNTSSTSNFLGGSPSSNFLFSGSTLFGTLQATSSNLTSFSMVDPSRTCVVSNGSNYYELNFALPVIDAKTATLIRNTGAGFTSFSIQLYCASPVTKVTARVVYTGSSVNGAWIANTAPTDLAAKDVYILLLDKFQRPISSNGTIDLIPNGSTKISAQYMSKPNTTITPGLVKGVATLYLNYF